MLLFGFINLDELFLIRIPHLVKLYCPPRRAKRRDRDIWIVDRIKNNALDSNITERVKNKLVNNAFNFFVHLQH